MLVKVKLFSFLNKYAPGGTGEAFDLELPERSTIADLITRLEIRPNEVSIAYVNGEARATLYRLRPGDEVGFFPPVGGG
jgi:molybdopterin converting factor small subunit